MQAKVIREKSYYKSILAIAIPIALQNLINFAVNMTDTLMVGALGQLQLSATSLANQTFSLFSTVMFGLASGGSVMIAQYWGKRDTKSIQKILGISIKISLSVAAVLMVFIFLFPDKIMSVFSNEPDVIAEGARYLKLVVFSFGFSGFASVIMISLRGVEQVKISIIVYLTSFIVNVFFNYTFIFGNFGAPKMGVVGAALGTLIARVVEFVMILIYLLFFEKDIHFKFSYALKSDSAQLRQYMKTSLPVVGNEFLWGLGSSTQAVVIGRMGSAVVAANSITQIIMQLAIIFIIGLSNAAAVITGKIIGEGNYQRAKDSAKTMQLLSVVTGIVGGTIIICLKDFMISLYNIPQETQVLAGQMMMVAAVIIFFVSIELIENIGILRGGGDTKYVLFVDTFFMWAIAIPLGFITGLHLHLAAPLVYLCLRIDSPIKVILSFFRIRSGSWIKDVTVKSEESVNS